MKNWKRHLQMPQHRTNSLSLKRTWVGDQLALFEDANEKVVNVASVPQRSPFRYPGGKTWLIPHVRRWLYAAQSDGKTLLEPFAGGGIVSLTAVAENHVSRAILVERDESVAAVWQVMFDGRAKALAKRIVSFEFTNENVSSVLARRVRSDLGMAFNTLLRNRVSHGGILAEGAGLIKNGENGKGLSSRWYPDTLERRILEIDGLRDRLQIVCGDGFKVIRRYAKRDDILLFLDPPYTVAGRRLYRYSDIDNRALFAAASEFRGDFLMTYDHATEISDMAAEFGFETALVPMQNTHLATKKELLIGRDLSWLR